MKPNSCIRGLAVISFLALLTNCNNVPDSKKPMEMENNVSEEELYRPNFHFTPKENWMNDPNGMFYLDGIYHLFFQYYPDDNVWGPMHWGHAVSKDMVVWEEKKIAIYPDSLGYIFSGSAVVDHMNSSGFGDGNTPVVVSIFTYHDPVGEKEGKIDFQSQAIAYSHSKGNTWIKYDGNPVIPNPGIKDFRDPKVIWDEDHDQWIMVLATYSETLFYGSPNLKEWSLLSRFGDGIGAHGGVWECPDFFPMKIDGSDDTKWVLLQSLNPGSANGGSGTQYFIGDFDGSKFILDPVFENQLNKNGAMWLDHGRDNYAGVTWSNVPKEDGRTLFIGWMSNWDYALTVPTEKWRSSMTIARELSLSKIASGYVLRSHPVRELYRYSKSAVNETDIVFSGSHVLADRERLDLTKAIVVIDLTIVAGTKYTFELSNASGEILKFGIDTQENKYFIDRSGTGKIDFSEKFANSISTATYEALTGNLQMTFLIDKTSIELFYNNGETVMTEIFFPTQPLNTLTLKSDADKNLINTLNIHALKF